MDIKDFILIGGGILIAAVIVHGFWIAWRARRDPLRLDLVTDLATADDEDDLHRLRAELPNGGARVVNADAPAGQGDLEFERGSARVDVDAAGRARKTEPRLGPATEKRPEPPPAPRDKVTDVILPERTLKAEEPKEPRRWPARRPGGEGRPAERAPARAARGALPEGGAEVRKGAEGRKSAESRRGGDGRRGGEARKNDQAVQEIIVVNVLAPKGKPFVGGGLVEALRARGLRYGDMNIFHRLDPQTRQSLYSVANVVEPGTFDLADLDGFRSPGVCFFMQLPGPEQPLEAFEDMLKVARDVAMRVGGSLLDEQRSVMTGQTVEHYRQRISDFCRRRMSMRA